MKRIIFITALIVLIVLSLCGCSSSEGEGFAIYLPAGDIRTSELPALSHIDIEDSPLISEKDIILYSVATHEIQLTQQAYDRLDTIEVPTSGKPFVICVDKQPIYTGAFWVWWSSQSFDGITIMKPLTHDGTLIQIKAGYPSQGFFTGEDPRSDHRIIAALDNAGKLD